MPLYHKAQSLLRQFFQNLDEADWASRHLTDGGMDLKEAARSRTADGETSSLVLALQQMGLVRLQS